MLDEVAHRALSARRHELERDVFQHPPKTFDEFAERRGRWLELTDMIQQMEDAAKASDLKESKR